LNEERESGEELKKEKRRSSKIGTKTDAESKGIGGIGFKEGRIVSNRLLSDCHRPYSVHITEVKWCRPYRPNWVHRNRGQSSVVHTVVHRNR